MPNASRARSLAVSPEGDELDITGLMESPAHEQDSLGRTSDCTHTAFTFDGAIFSPCGQIQVYDATYTSDNQYQTHLPDSNNSQTVQVWDSCGQQVLNDYSWGWASSAFPYYPRFAGGWTTTGVYVTLDDQSCYGTWTQSYAFTQVFADGDQLSVTLTSTFDAYPDAPIVTQSISESYGGSPIHASQGDPVDSLSGAFNYHPTSPDLYAAALGQPLSMSRSYASNSPHDGWFGPGWSSSYDASLTVDADTGAVTYHDPAGPVDVFQPDGSGGYTPPPGVLSQLTSTADGYRLLLKDQTAYLFDSTGRLTDIRDRNNQGPHLSYSGGALSSISNGNRSIRATINGTGHITDLDLNDGRSVRYDYTDGQLTSFTDATGAVTQYGYDSDGLLNSVEDPDGNYPVRLTYDPSSGRVVSQQDPMGNVTQFGWTPTDPSNPRTGTATVTTPRGGVWTDVYTNGYLVRQEDPSGATTRYSWTDNGQMARIVPPDGDATYFGYDSAGNLTSRTLDVPGSQQNRATETYTYNPVNDLTSTVDFDRHEVDYGYGARGNLTTITRFGPGVGHNVVAVTNVYNADGTLASSTDAMNATTTYQYNADGDLTGITTPLGRTTSFGRDAAGRLTSVVDPRGNVAGNDPDDYRTRFAYDDDDRLTQTTDPLGDVTSTGVRPGWLCVQHRRCPRQHHHLHPRR